MMDIDSALGMSIASIPTASLAWGGFLSDSLLQVLPNGFVPYIACYGMIGIAFAIIWQKNAFELMSGELSWGKVAAGASVFGVGTYFTLVSSSSVFLYYNF
jgi:alginate O-acetyltransferase complex protein AlgI